MTKSKPFSWESWKRELGAKYPPRASPSKIQVLSPKHLWNCWCTRFLFLSGIFLERAWAQTQTPPWIPNGYAKLPRRMSHRTSGRGPALTKSLWLRPKLCSWEVCQCSSLRSCPTTPSYEQRHFYANKAKTEMRHFRPKHYKTRCTPVKWDRFLKSPRNVEGAQTVKCKLWTERLAEKGLSRGVSRAAWKRRINRELEAKKVHKPWIREGLNREVQTMN